MQSMANNAGPNERDELQQNNIGDFQERQGNDANSLPHPSMVPFNMH